MGTIRVGASWAMPGGADVNRQHWRTVRALSMLSLVFVLTLLWPEHAAIWIPCGVTLTMVIA